jgi:NitT/TauT family transport system substrate-binding protein
MRARSTTRLVALLAVVGLGVAACGSDDDKAATTTTVAAATETTAAAAETTAAATETTAGVTETTAGATDTTGAATDSTGGSAAGDAVCDASKAPADLTPVKLQLQWFTQAQFAGYFAAQDQGCYAEAGLDVEILEGGVEIVPQTVLADGQADFAIAWVPKALASREAGADIVDIAQVFQRSGTLQVSFKDAAISSPADFKGKVVGNWGFGNEYEIFAALAANDLTPADVTLVAQQFDMSGLLAGDIDAAEAMTYNEYAQVLETVNPDTGELYTADDFTAISYEDEGVGMLQDAIWASGERLSDPDYQATATAFVKASLKVWIYCRDNAESCRDIVVAKGSKLGASHQLWQMNEINKLIWPAEQGVGYIDPAAWDRTVGIAIKTPNADGDQIITADPGADAYTNDYVSAAIDELTAEGYDVSGDSFSPLDVTLEEGGN